MDVEGRLYALFCVILYKGLEHPWILVAENPETNLLWRLRNNCNFLGSQMLYTDFFLLWLVPLISTLFKGQEYIHIGESPQL